MEQFTQILLLGGHKRARLVYSLLYIISCLAICTKILAFYGFVYTSPKEINVTTLLDLIFKGKYVLPMIVFGFTMLGATLIVIILNGLFGYFLNLLLKCIAPTCAESLYVAVDSLGEKRGWFHLEDSKYVKGKNFKMLVKYEKHTAYNLRLSILSGTTYLNAVIIVCCYAVPPGVCGLSLFIFSVALLASLIIGSQELSQIGQLYLISAKGFVEQE